MAAWKRGPALASGCTSILKPAEQTPLSALRLGELIIEAGFPPGVVNIITSSDHGVGALLAKDPRVDMVSFTGSTATGRSVMSDAAVSIKKVFLELGGKSAFVVLDDADLGGACSVAAFTTAMRKQLVAELAPAGLEQLERAPEIGACVVERLVVQGFGPRGIVVSRAIAGQPGQADLHADIAEALRHDLASILDGLLDLRAAGVGVRVDGLAAFAAGELIDGHPGLAAFDIP